MRLTEVILSNPLAYRLWQAPFVDRKLAPVLERNDLGGARRVLDVGCGPGTNARRFEHSSYVGLDVNPEYIASARKRCKGTFLVADVTRHNVEAGDRFDFILVNSLLHHLDDGDTRRLLSHLGTLLAPGGKIHVLDLVEPEGPCVARLLARLDRGHHARSLARWRDLFAVDFEIDTFMPYALRVFGLPLWQMVYVRGEARSRQA